MTHAMEKICASLARIPELLPFFLTFSKQERGLAEGRK